MSALGRISLRSILYFVGFSIVGLGIGVGVFNIFPVGDPSILELVNINPDQVAATVTAWDSFKNLILSIFPSNLLGAFVNIKSRILFEIRDLISMAKRHKFVP